ncbi:type IV secretory system conjugative DNA transfer family protein [Williamsoniiplasma lucivorax]|nr:type IV secretory system conjugative DNA transfer family protein [Williamsoniiplasma lucivorax]
MAEKHQLGIDQIFKEFMNSKFYIPKINWAFYGACGGFAFFSFYSIKQVFFAKIKIKDHVSKTESEEYGGAKWLIDERKPKEVNLENFEEVYAKNFDKPSYLTRTSTTKINSKIVLMYHGISVREVVHQIIIGSTGSGKTQKTILPTIWTNSRLKDFIDEKTGEKINNKPSFVITDPKGEIFDTTKMDLEAQGYDVKVLNFKDPFKSMGWNPLSQTLKFYTLAITYNQNNIKKILNKKDEKSEKLLLDYVTKNSCLKHTKQNCSVCFDEFKAIKKKSYYWVDTYNLRIIYSKEEFDKYLLSQIKYFKSLAFQEIIDLAETIINSSATKDAIWPNGAKSLLKGVLFAMLEIKEKDFDAITEKNFNMVTVQKILANRTQLNDWFKQYGAKNPTSNAWTTCSAQIDCSENTNSSFFSAVADGTRIFADESLQDILCKNDIDLFSMASNDKPTALFLIIPDQRKDKHPLASLFVSQLYLACSFVADRNRVERGKEELDRDLMFLLDEFGNMPAIANFDTILSVSRSRRIFFTLIVQDLAQIDKEYDKAATTIKSNCLLTVYLKSDNEKINQLIAEKCGKETVLTRGISDDKKQLEKSSTSMTGKDLITPSDLFQLTKKDKDLAAVLYAGMQPSITRLKHYFKLKEAGVMEFFGSLQFDSRPNPIIYGEEHFFNLANYGITKMDNTKFKTFGNPNMMSKNLNDALNQSRPKPKTLEVLEMTPAQKKEKLKKLQKQLFDAKTSLDPDEDEIIRLKKEIDALEKDNFN